MYLRGSKQEKIHRNPQSYLDYLFSPCPRISVFAGLLDMFVTAPRKLVDQLGFARLALLVGYKLGEIEVAAVPLF